MSARNIPPGWYQDNGGFVLDATAWVGIAGKFLAYFGGEPRLRSQAAYGRGGLDDCRRQR